MAVKHVSFAGKLPAGMVPSRPTAKKTATRVGVGTARPMKTEPGRSGASRTPMASGSARAFSTNQLQNGMKGALAGGTAALSSARRGASGGSTYGAGLGINSVPGQRISPAKHASLQRTARTAQLQKMNNRLASAKRASANDAKLYQYQLAKSGAKKAKKVLTKLKKRGV